MRPSNVVPFVAWRRSLSGRLLVLTLFFVMVSEGWIYVPSIAGLRHTYLEGRIAVARDLVEAHGGLLALHRTSDSGTTFRTELPTNVLELPAEESDHSVGAG